MTVWKALAAPSPKHESMYIECQKHILIIYEAQEQQQLAKEKTHTHFFYNIII